MNSRDSYRILLWLLLLLSPMPLCAQVNICYDFESAVGNSRPISSDLWDPDVPFCPDGTYYYRFMARSDYGTIRQNGTIEVLR